MNNPSRHLLRRALSAGAVGIALLTLAPSRCAANPRYLEGIDISHWQGAPRWRQVRDDGVQFVIAKASEGRTWTDGQYARNHRRARKLGYPLCGLSLCRPGKGAKDAVIEADNFVAAAQLAAADLLPVLDLEDAAPLVCAGYVAG